MKIVYIEKADFFREDYIYLSQFSEITVTAAYRGTAKLRETHIIPWLYFEEQLFNLFEWCMKEGLIDSLLFELPDEEMVVF